MKISLKPIRDQVIVLTGASSGIGLATARLAARKGAKLVLAARNEEALRKIAEEIKNLGNGGEAIYIAADVGIEADVKRIAQTAMARFGGWDTWINDAGVGIFGRLLDGNPEDYRRLFETNFWGVVYGSLEAARQMIASGRGGAIINVGSTVSDRTIHLQGIYSASKHAVKGFTDALRMELEADNAPISVTLIQPGSVDTPFPQHARNYLDREPTLPPPVYSPDVVAHAILHCAEVPMRSLFVGSGGKGLATMERYLPGLADKAMATRKFEQTQETDRPPQQPQGALYAPTFGLKERGEYEGHVRKTSLYTAAAMHPLLTAATVLALGAAGLALVASTTGGSSSRNGTESVSS